MTQREDAPIFLIGYRGTGKTTIASELASRLGYAWVDADDVTEARAGRTIAEIFAAQGEAAFRELEAETIASLVNRTGTVVGLGGGAILREANRQAICAAGPVVWLTAAVDTILARLAADPITAERRPNLTTTGGRAEIEKLLAERTPLYRECATLTVDTEGKSAAQVADEIAARL